MVTRNLEFPECYACGFVLYSHVKDEVAEGAQMNDNRRAHDGGSLPKRPGRPRKSIPIPDVKGEPDLQALITVQQGVAQMRVEAISHEITVLNKEQTIQTDIVVACDVLIGKFSLLEDLKNGKAASAATV